MEVADRERDVRLGYQTLALMQQGQETANRGREVCCAGNFGW